MLRQQKNASLMHMVESAFHNPGSPLRGTSTSVCASVQHEYFVSWASGRIRKRLSHIFIECKCVISIIVMIIMILIFVAPLKQKNISKRKMKEIAEAKKT